MGGPGSGAAAAAAETVIVGAGPAGLAMAGRLRRLGRPFELLEREDRVAPAWHRHYDRLHLHTVKETSHLPHLPFPPEAPRYLPRALLLEYFEAYRRRFDLRPRFGEEVVRIERQGEGWRTETAAGSVYRSGHVVVATGFNRVPHRPSWPGMEKFAGSIAHSVAYRAAAPFAGRRVLVVGMGNSGAEIALDLAENGAQTAISVRGPVNIVPRDVLGRPTQRTAMLLARLPERLGDALGVLLRKLTVGDLSRWGIETPAEPPAAQLRRSGKTPVIDVGTLARIRAGQIRVLPGIGSFGERTVRFVDGREEPFDRVVLATGFRSRVQDFLPDCEGLLDELGHPAVVSPRGPHEGLHFLGFDAYSVGGLLHTIHRDSERIAARIGRSSRAAGDGGREER